MLKNRLSKQSPYLLFLPYLFLFVIIVLVTHNNVMEGDESTYYRFAQNLLNGFYSPPPPDINLWAGPGYPIVLTPFLVLGLPQISITLMNAVFQYLSIVFLFKAMRYFIPFGKAMLFSCLFGFCYSSYKLLGLIYTEPFTLFLLSLLALCLVRAFEEDKRNYVYFAGFIVGYIALTKIIFGYVLLILFIGGFLLWLTNQKAGNYQKSLLIGLIAFLTTIPYLIYTYNLTGKMFYWGNSGGMSLYWMSTPHEKEYGDWHNEMLFAEEYYHSHNPQLVKLHLANMNEIFKHKGVARDSLYKKMAIENIKNHPVKYLKNITANVNRLLFGFPFSYKRQYVISKIIYFSILLTLIFFCLIPTLIYWKNIPFSIRYLLFLTLIYLGGSSLVSAYNRQFLIIVPILLFWIAYIIDRSIKVNFSFGKKEGTNE